MPGIQRPSTLKRKPFHRQLTVFSSPQSLASAPGAPLIPVPNRTTFWILLLPVAFLVGTSHAWIVPSSSRVRTPTPLVFRPIHGPGSLLVPGNFRNTQRALYIPQSTTPASSLPPSAASSLKSLTRLEAIPTTIIMAEEPPSTWLATALGYLVGLGSLMLYTPIAVRLFRQKSAEGTTMTTWMMKLSSYTCTDLYSLWKQYPISTYIETLIITLEAAIILVLVVIYQQRFPRDPALWIFLLVFSTLAAYLYFEAPPEVLAMGQLSSAALNSGALVPQFVLNFQKQTKGDYSPVTAALAATGCAIRLYTIQQLADNDPILLFSFGTALLLNTLLLLQIVYYGVMVEGLSLGAVLSADLNSSSSSNSNHYEPVTSKTSAEEGDPLPIMSRFAVMAPLEVSTTRSARSTTTTTDDEDEADQQQLELGQRGSSPALPSAGSVRHRS